MAGTAQAIRAGTAYVELLLKDKLAGGLRAAEAKLKAFGGGVASVGKMLAGLGGATLAPLLAAARHFSEFGDQLDKMSQRTGLSVEALSELGYAAELSGGSLESIDHAFKGFANFTEQLRRGGAEAQATLLALGVSLDELEGKTPEEVFERLADAVAGMGDESQQAALASKVFGESSRALLPLLQQGAAGIRDMRGEARRFGQQVTTEDAQAAAALNDAWGRVKRTISATAFQIGAALAPGLTDLANVVAASISAVVAWVRENRELVVTTAKIAAVVTLAGGALLGLGLAIKAVGFGIGGLVAGAALVKAVFVGAFVVVKSLAVAAGAGILALASPVGLVTALVVGLGVAGVYALGRLFARSEEGQRVFATLGAGWRGLRETAATSWDGIVDAISAGDLELAGNLAITGLKLGWEQMVAALRSTWLDFKQWFVRTSVEMVNETRVGFDRVSTGLATLYGIATRQSREYFNQLQRMSAQADANIRRTTPGAGLRAPTAAEREARERIIGLEIDLRNLREQASIAAAQAAARRNNPPGGDSPAAGLAAASRVIGTFSAAAIGGLGGSQVGAHLRNLVGEARRQREILADVRRDLNAVLRAG